MSPSACWPPGSPEGSWCRRGAMPGRQGRMSGTPPPRSSPTVSPFVLDGLPGPRLAGHGRWRDGDAPSARAASLASSAALLTHRATPLPGPTSGRRPYVIPHVNPYVIPYALGVRTPGFAGRAHQCWSVPRGGVERPGRVDALRAIDSSACPRSWRTGGPRRLRRQTQACPSRYAGWSGMTEGVHLSHCRSIDWRSEEGPTRWSAGANAEHRVSCGRPPLPCSAGYGWEPPATPLAPSPRP
jgi:hypothetical protein